MATFAGAARGFDAAKRRPGGAAFAVHLDHAGLQGQCQPVAAGAILRLDVVRQAIGGVIGDADGVSFGVKGDDRQHRAEDFLARDGHAGGHIGKDRGLDVKTAVEPLGQTRATGHQPRAFVDALLDESLNLLPLAAIDHRPHVLAGLMRRADLDAIRHPRRDLHRAVIGRALHQHP